MALLSTASVGRIGVNIDALPTVLPVNFALFNGSVVFRTAPGTKLHFATRDAVVAFQADHYGSVREPTGWSVLVRGVAQTLTDPSVLSTCHSNHGDRSKAAVATTSESNQPSSPDAASCHETARDGLRANECRSAHRGTVIRAATKKNTSVVVAHCREVDTNETANVRIAGIGTFGSGFGCGESGCCRCEQVRDRRESVGGGSSAAMAFHRR